MRGRADEGGPADDRSRAAGAPPAAASGRRPASGHRLTRSETGPRTDQIPRVWPRRRRLAPGPHVCGSAPLAQPTAGAARLVPAVPPPPRCWVPAGASVVLGLASGPWCLLTQVRKSIRSASTGPGGALAGRPVASCPSSPIGGSSHGGPAVVPRCRSCGVVRCLVAARPRAGPAWPDRAGRRRPTAEPLVVSWLPPGAGRVAVGRGFFSRRPADRLPPPLPTVGRPSCDGLLRAANRREKAGDRAGGARRAVSRR